MLFNSGVFLKFFAGFLLLYWLVRNNLRARNILIVTDDPDATFRHLTPFLQRARLLVSLVVAARAANEGRYRVLWPADHQGEFSLA